MAKTPAASAVKTKKTFKRNTSGLRPWKKGQSGNPLGVYAGNPAVKEFKDLTNAEVAKVGALVVKNDFNALKAISIDPTASVLSRWIAAVAVKGIEDGDVASLEVLLTRFLGKPKEHIHHTGEVHAAPQVIITLPDNMRDRPETIEEPKPVNQIEGTARV